jgi:hypothetical protein
MKKKIALITICMTVSHIASYAQNKINIENAKDGANINVLLSDSQFLFSDFQNATIYFKNGGIAKSLMNYNMLTGEMQFVDENKKDTLSLTDSNDIRLITFGKRSFVYTAKGYSEILAEHNETALLVNRRIKMANMEAYGAYGTKTGTSFVSNVSSMTDNYLPRNKINMSTVSSITYTLTSIYLLQSGKKIYRGATEKNFQRVFNKQKKDAIKEYIKNENINLKNEEDIIKLFKFLADNE